MAVKKYRKDINLYKRYLYDPEKEAKKRFLIRTIAPLGILVVIIGGVFAFFLVGNIMKKNEIDDLNRYINAPSTIIQYEESLKAKNERDRLADTYTDLSNILNAIKSYPKVDREVMSEVQGSLGGVKLDSYAYDSTTGILMISVSASSEEIFPEFVKRLKDTGLFADVGYVGYEGGDSESADGQRTGQQYATVVSALLKTL